MKRYAINQLVEWQQSPRRKPLVLEGARQVGKTWLVSEFARTHYKNFAYVNFEEMKYLANLFEADFDVQRIVTAINAATHQTCKAGETLIFLDEIQESPGGLTALKYFAEQAPELHVIAAGSLLGIELHRKASFPVGKVQMMTLYPMSFREFLEALGEEQLAMMITAGRQDELALFGDKLRELLRYYLYVGGMPEVVKSFSESRDWDEVRRIQSEILEGYDRDFSKHAPTEIVPRIRQVWESLPAQLSKENRKFLYGIVRQGARAREYEIALQWLQDSGLIYKVCNVSAPRLPLKAYSELSNFKLYTLDVGLLGAMTNLDSATIIKGNDIFTEFKGALAEQYVLQQLMLKHVPYYFAKENSRMEIDFLIQEGSDIVPIEVKAEVNAHAKSFKQYLADYSPAKAYRLSMLPYKAEEKFVNLPLYCAEIL